MKDCIYFDNRWDWGWASVDHYNIGVDVTNDGFVAKGSLKSAMRYVKNDVMLDINDPLAIKFVHVDESNRIDINLSFIEASRILKLKEL